MEKEEKSKPYDLEERTYQFARRVRVFLRELKPGPLDMDDARNRFALRARWVQTTSKPMTR